LKTTDVLDCVIQNRDYDRIADRKTFCAQSSEVGVCKGDSGSGFYVTIEDRIYLKGIVSSAIYSKCSQKKVALYTDVSEFYDFISVNIKLDLLEN
jgi:secreted trypsin-like serine protease